MTNLKFAQSVGVAPGTTTMQLGTVWNPYATSIFDMRGVGAIVDTRARVRWDLIGGIGGLALVVALGAGFIANAIGD